MLAYKFIADRTNGRTYACYSVASVLCRLSVTLCIKLNGAS